MAAVWVLAVAALVAATPFLAQRLRGLSYAPRNVWLSFAGGVPLAFVFLELLPALAEGEREAEAKGLLSHVPYAVALAGFALFYGLERIAARRADRDGDGDDDRGPGGFLATTISYALLNAVAAYLLVEEERALPAFALFALALTLKLFVADRALYERHREAYDRVARWVLFGSFVAGAAAGHLAHVAPLPTLMMQAFLAGALILVVVKEELPSERKARWEAFAAGAVVFAGLFLGANALQ